MITTLVFERILSFPPKSPSRPFSPGHCRRPVSMGAAFRIKTHVSRNEIAKRRHRAADSAAILLWTKVDRAFQKALVHCSTIDRVQDAAVRRLRAAPEECRRHASAVRRGNVVEEMTGSDLVHNGESSRNNAFVELRDDCVCPVGKLTESGRTCEISNCAAIGVARTERDSEVSDVSSRCAEAPRQSASSLFRDKWYSLRKMLTTLQN
jgi:hypothetical protein